MLGKLPDIERRTPEAAVGHSPNNSGLTVHKPKALLRALWVKNCSPRSAPLVQDSWGGGVRGQMLSSHAAIIPTTTPGIFNWVLCLVRASKTACIPKECWLHLGVLSQDKVPPFLPGGQFLESQLCWGVGGLIDSSLRPSL